MNKTELQQVMDALQSVCNRPDTAESYDAMMAGVQAAIALCEASQARLTDGDLHKIYMRIGQEDGIPYEFGRAIIAAINAKGTP